MALRIITTRLLFNSKLKTNCGRQFLATVVQSKHAEDKSTPKSTVDQEDVDRHAKQMNEWWDPHGPMKALHSYNLVRVPLIRNGLVDCPPEARVPEPLKGLKILDIGCGGGILSEPLAKLGAKVTGVDASPELIECATKHSQMNRRIADNNKPTYICSSIEEHAPSNENAYDGVVASEVIEHVNNKELFIKSCVQVLKPGGRIFFTTPNRTKIAELAVIFLAENVFNLTPKGTHQIEKFITPTELSFLIERNNCHVELISGLWYNLCTNAWSWSSFDHFVYALQAVKLEDKK